MAGSEGPVEFTEEEEREYTDLELGRERVLNLAYSFTGVAKNHRHEKWLKLKASQQIQVPSVSESVNSDEFPVG